jgi:hypothetical protein
MHLNEPPRIAVAPRRQLDVIDALAILFDTKVESVEIEQELGQTVKLGYQLLCGACAIACA